ncbi:hypothetical protein PO124_33285 [Bacillus licheniformis]|nr:hypothetical protein [Bacillus licheniformis]
MYELSLAELDAIFKRN